MESDSETAVDQGDDLARILPPAPEPSFHLGVDGDGVVISSCRSNAPQAGMVEVSEAVFDAAVLGRCRYVDGQIQAYDPPPAPLPVPDAISDRQCFQQLAVLGRVTQDEALAAVRTGAMPKAVTNGIAALPADQQFAATMVISGATTFYRLHPLTLVFLSFFGIGEADRDPLWTAAAAL